MNIRPATAGDEEGIAVAHVRAWQAAYRGIVSDVFLDGLNAAERATRWAEVLRDPNCKLLVAMKDDRVLGFVSFGKSREEQAAPRDGEVWTMYVDPTSWRQGVGQALMREALSALERGGYAAVWVWVLQANSQAIAFYESCGFALQPGTYRCFKLGGQDVAEVSLLHHAA